MIAFAGVVGAKPKPQPKEAPDYTRLQIFLDNANFGPGKIDGHDGDFTKKALALYRAAQGIATAAATDAKAPVDISGIDLGSVDPTFIKYEVTKEDM